MGQDAVQAVEFQGVDDRSNNLLDAAATPGSRSPKGSEIGFWGDSGLGAAKMEIRALGTTEGRGDAIVPSAPASQDDPTGRLGDFPPRPGSDDLGQYGIDAMSHNPSEGFKEQAAHCSQKISAPFLFRQGCLEPDIVVGLDRWHRGFFLRSRQIEPDIELESMDNKRHVVTLIPLTGQGIAG